MPMSTITVAGISPTLNILGATQQFNYTQQLSALQITNSFIPSVGLPSQFNEEYRNNLLSGFRWTHLTTDTDTHGSLTLQSFVNAQSSGVDMLSFTESNNIEFIVPLVISSDLDMNGNKITNLATPTLGTDAVTKDYADSATSGLVTLVSDITGSGNVGTNIITTFKPDPIFLGTGSITIPVGTTAERPVTPAEGMSRYNSTISNQEIYNGSIWRPVGTGDGDGSVTSVTASTGLDGGVITTTGSISIADTAVTPASYTNASFTVNAQGQLTAANSNPTGIQASLYMVGNIVTTSILVADDFVKAGGATTSTLLNNFTMPLSNRFLYTGTNSITALVHANISLSGTGANRTYGVAIYKNGVQVLSPQYQEHGNNNIGNIAVIAPVVFATNDYIEIFVTASNTSTITVQNINLSITL
jgi:hypothetical protein